MGTNYYVRHPACGHCRRREPDRHVGKSSGGWAFALRVYEGLESLEDWEEEWRKEGNEIVNESGESLTADEMRAVILRDRRGDVFGHVRHTRDYDDPYYKVRPGGPTYDLCDYEFS